MRRVTIALGILAILLSSCGRDEPPAAFTRRLQDQVASVRELAEAGRPGLASDRLHDLVAMVSSRLAQGSIDEALAVEILEAAETVDARLSLLPRPSRTESPSPPPEEEDGGYSGKDKGKGNGDGDEGHGND